METGVARASLARDSAERFHRLREALGVTSFGINQMVLQPGQRGRIHRHKRQEEVYLVIEGTLTVAVEEVEEELTAGDLMRVGPEARRQLINRGSERVLFVALGGSGEHESRDGEAFTDWDQLQGAPPQEVELPADLDVG